MPSTSTMRAPAKAVSELDQVCLNIFGLELRTHDCRDGQKAKYDRRENAGGQRATGVQAAPERARLGLRLSQRASG